MNENVNITCICKLGFDKGAIKKTIENNIFTIYGNLIKENSIVIRYHGILSDNIEQNNYTNNLQISYFFDNDESTKNSVTLARCTECIGQNYCAIIDLEKHNNISFEFIDKNTNKKDGEQPFKLDIIKDPVKDLMHRYGFEENTELPAILPNKNKFYSILSNLQLFFKNIFTKSSAL